MAIPLPDQIQTLRLVLRAPRETDAAAIFNAYTQDADVARYMVWRPHKIVAETEGFIASCMQGWASGTARPYVLALHANEDMPIGMLDARILQHTVDLGYVLGRQHWGSGLMCEAVSALTEATLSLPDYFRVQATCDVENRASARTLENAGFKREGIIERHLILPNISADPRASLMYARCKPTTLQTSSMVGGV